MYYVIALRLRLQRDKISNGDERSIRVSRLCTSEGAGFSYRAVSGLGGALRQREAAVLIVLGEAVTERAWQNAGGAWRVRGRTVGLPRGPTPLPNCRRWPTLCA